VKLPLGG